MYIIYFLYFFFITINHFKFILFHNNINIFLCSYFYFLLLSYDDTYYDIYIKFLFFPLLYLIHAFYYFSIFALFSYMLDDELIFFFIPLYI